MTLPLDNRVRILVYKATSSGIAPADADACGKRTDCVAYSLDPNSGKFVVTSGSWSPTAVNACIGDSGADYVGVSVRTTHDWLIGFAFPGSGGPGISSKTVMKFEPVIPRTDSEDFQKKCKGA